MKIIDCIQSSVQWHELRFGKVTASKFSAVLAKGQGKTRKSYMMQLAAEILTGQQQDSYSNSAMEWGTEQEPNARKYYEAVNNCKVEQVGFVERDEWIACSPDGLVGDDGLIEIKCCNSTTYITTILANKMPTTHIPQVQGQLWVCERKYCDFVSYDPRVKDRPFFCKRVYRDETFIKELEVQVVMFVEELKEMIDKLVKHEF